MPHCVREQRLTLGVDRRELELLGIGDVSRQEAPEHHVQRAGFELLIPHDDWLHRLRREVVIRGDPKREAVNMAESKGFGNALFIRSTLITSTHRPDSIADSG